MRKVLIVLVLLSIGGCYRPSADKMMFYNMMNMKFCIDTLCREIDKQYQCELEIRSYAKKAVERYEQTKDAEMLLERMRDIAGGNHDRENATHHHLEDTRSRR